MKQKRKHMFITLKNNLVNKFTKNRKEYGIIGVCKGVTHAKVND